MPGKKTRRFIDKKNAVKFHLVHRSQRDPLQADEDAPQRVLLPEKKEREARKKEERQYGVFFDDEYDYLQHLKDTKELYNEEEDKYGWTLEQIPRSRHDDVEIKDTLPSTEEQEPVSKLKLSSRMFASAIETEVGLLNKAAPVSGPKIDWDPDIVAGLDEDFDFEDPDNILEDDFIEMANAGDGKHPKAEDGSDDEEEYNYDSDTMTGSLDDGSELADSLGGDLYMQEEVKSRFTNYSTTSSVIRRNEELKLLDDRFEQLYSNYGEDEIGALDEEEIAGAVDVNGDLLNQLAEEYTTAMANIPTLAKTVDESVDESVEKTPIVTMETQDEDSDNDSDSENKHVIMMSKPAEQWDCESILSTYSNLYNRPKLIIEENRGKKKNRTIRSQSPEEEVEPSLTRNVDGVCNYRPKDETTDEKQQRKKAIKEERQFRRQEKKANKMAFKKEKQRQEKEHLNLKTNLKNIKLT